MCFLSSRCFPSQERGRSRRHVTVIWPDQGQNSKDVPSDRLTTITHFIIMNQRAVTVFQLPCDVSDPTGNSTLLTPCTCVGLSSSSALPQTIRPAPWPMTATERVLKFTRNNDGSNYVLLNALYFDWPVHLTWPTLLTDPLPRHDLKERG